MPENDSERPDDVPMIMLGMVIMFAVVTLGVKGLAAVIGPDVTWPWAIAVAGLGVIVELVCDLIRRQVGRRRRR